MIHAILILVIFSFLPACGDLSQSVDALDGPSQTLPAGSNDDVIDDEMPTFDGGGTDTDDNSPTITGDGGVEVENPHEAGYSTLEFHRATGGSDSLKITEAKFLFSEIRFQDEPNCFDTVEKTGDDPILTMMQVASGEGTVDEELPVIPYKEWVFLDFFEDYPVDSEFRPVGHSCTLTFSTATADPEYVNGEVELRLYEGQSILISGVRGDGVPFRIMSFSAFDFDVPIRQYFDANRKYNVDVVFDLDRMLEGIDLYALEATWAGVTIYEGRNREAYDQFIQNLSRAITVESTLSP